MTVIPIVLTLLLTAQDAPRQPHTFMRDIAQLSDEELKQIEGGKAFAKILETEERPEVHVFGAVYINAPIEAYVAMHQDLESLSKTDAYLGLKRFSHPPRLSDVEGLTFPEEDIRDLRTCKPGKCKIQLPADDMARFKAEIDWDAPDAAEQVNRLIRTMAFEGVEIYQKGGLEALGAYQDKKKPTGLAEAFEGLLSRFSAIQEYGPELHRYLLDYPEARLAGVQDIFYWEKVKFGLKPTVRLNHVTLRKVPAPEISGYVFVNKQLYASHYFQAAVALSLCVTDTAHPERPGFYLITLKSSRQHGLTGFRGKLMRGQVVKRTREATEKFLAAYKMRLESGQERAR